MDFDYIDYLANLAKLELKESEKEWIDKHINQAIESGKILDEIDADIEKNMAGNIKDYTGEKAVTLRKDKVEEFFNIEKLLENAISKEGNYFKLNSK